MPAEAQTIHPVLTKEEVATFLDRAFPHSPRAERGEIETLSPGRLRINLDPVARMQRPGNIVSGPTQMALADHAAYAVILAHVGLKEMAVTNALSIVFLRACQFERLVADATLLKLGRRLVTVDVRLWQQNEARMIAQATIGYALP